jgi:hypothetical protein
MDATGRIMPCCYDPLKEPTSIFGNIREAESLFNSPNFSSSRRYFATSVEASDPKTACPQCPYKHSSPHVSAKHAIQYLKMADVDQVLKPQALELLADW